MRALNRHVERVFNPDRKDHHWGKRKLTRDEQPTPRHDSIASGTFLGREAVRTPAAAENESWGAGSGKDWSRHHALDEPLS
jgi:hypothetical protein